MKALPIALLALSAPTFAQTLSYDAGLAGAPPIAPDPQTQGWGLVDPSAGMVIFGDVSPDGATGVNAWNIDDDVTFTGGRGHYAGFFTAEELDDVFALGWELSSTLRLIDTSGLDIFVEFATGTAGTDDRYLMFFTISGNDVIVSDLAGNSFPCPNGNDGDFHDYALLKAPAAVDAEFVYDGLSLGVWTAAGSSGSAPQGGVHWGSGSSAATAQAHFQHVEMRPLSIGTNFCTSQPNSSGSASLISAEGSLSIASNNIVLSAGPMATGEPGIFYYGPDEISVPFGNGTRCVGGPAGTIHRIFPFAQADGAGTMSSPINNTLPDHAPQLAVPGTTWKFQAWFRDPAGGGAGFDLSDGLSLTLVP